MALINLTVTNFQQPNITSGMSTSLSEVNGTPVADSNTLARSCLITLSPSTSQVNPTGGNDGWWGFSTRDLNITGVQESNWVPGGSTWSGWLNYSNPYSGAINPIPATQLDAYQTTPGMPLQFTEYDPGGGGTIYYPGNFTSSYPVTMQYGDEWVTVDQTYDYRIGHDLWRYALEGTMMTNDLGTVPYEPRTENPGSYYKVWFDAQNDTANGGLNPEMWDNALYANYIANWNPFVDRVVAVNSKMMIPNGFDGNNVMQWKPAQGNKVYVIVVLKDGITGQQIIESGGFISIDLGGEPEFYEFELIPDPVIDIPEDTLGESEGEGAVNEGYDLPDDYSIEDFAAMGGTVEVNITINAGDELTDVNIGQIFGDEGLTVDMSDNIDFTDATSFNEENNTYEINNTTSYDQSVVNNEFEYYQSEIAGSIDGGEDDNYGVIDGPQDLSFEQYLDNFCNDLENQYDPLCVPGSEVASQIAALLLEAGSDLGETPEP